MTDVEKLLGSPDETEVYSALIKIGEAGGREHERAVARFLEHASAKLRGAAIRVLGSTGDSPRIATAPSG